MLFSKSSNIVNHRLHVCRAVLVWYVWTASAAANGNINIYASSMAMGNKNQISLIPSLDAAFVNFGLCQECFYLPEEFIANVQQPPIPPSIAANIFS